MYRYGPPKYPDPVNRRADDRNLQTARRSFGPHGQARLYELTRLATKKNDARELREFYSSALAYLE